MPFLENPEKTMRRCFALIGKECVLHSDGSELNFRDLLDFKRRYPDAEFIEEIIQNEGGQPPCAPKPSRSANRLCEQDGSLRFVGLSATHRAGAAAPATPPQFLQQGFCAISIPSKELVTAEYSFQTLRQYFAANEEIKSAPLFRAKHILDWKSSSKFCSSCGKELHFHKELSALECPGCKKIYFPRIEPCVIIAVRNSEGKVLLARHTYRNTSMHACIAGFIEAGESAEQACRREVFEETGLRIKNLVYRGSQSWPFPDQLMLGFTAEYESGELVLQKNEIADASWFDPENCPDSPPPGSIAYKLIHNLF